MTASLLKSPGLSSIFWPISIILSLDGLHSSGFFQVFQSLFQSFDDCTKSTNYNWYHHRFHVSPFVCFFFSSPARSRYLSLFSLYFNFTLWSAGTSKSTILQVLLFFSFLFFFFFFVVDYNLVWPRLGNPFVSQNPRGVCVSRSPGHMLDCAYTICSYGQI